MVLFAFQVECLCDICIHINIFEGFKLEKKNRNNLLILKGNEVSPEEANEV